MQGKIWFAHMLRGLAALSVAIHHLCVAFWVANPAMAELAHTSPLAAIRHLPHLAVARNLAQYGLEGGPLGVAVFFLVSGFVIPISLEKVRWKQFLVQRVFRLYPTYWVGLTLTCGAMLLYAVVHELPRPVHFSAYWKSLTLCRDWLWAPSLDGITWTLEIEIKFYLLCAFLSAVSSLRSARALLASMTLLALAVHLTGDLHPSLAELAPRLYRLHYVLSCAAPYIPYMFIGTCFYNHFRGYWSTAKLCATTTILYSLAFISLRNGHLADHTTYFLGSYSMALVAFSIAYLLRDRLPRSRVLDGLANISYPLYCVHGVIGYVLLSEMVGRGLNPYGAIGLTFAVVVPCAYLIHRAVEQPSIGLGRIAIHTRFLGRLLATEPARKPAPPLHAPVPSRAA
jgi:peptidoglycan/LPS O-acetylase OafA/YrhL